MGQLLAQAALGFPAASADAGCEWTADAGATRQLRWALAGGLGPLLHRAGFAAHPNIPAAVRDAVTSAELTARVRHADLVDTARDIVSACAEVGEKPTLLKGISVSEELYPAGHLRPMSDVDVLVPAASYARIESALIERRYDLIAEPEALGGHHGAPLRHRSRQTLVELHTGLFPGTSPLSDGHVFAPGNVERQSRDSRFAGEPVRRLSPELQLVYIASSWFNDMTLHRFHASFLPSLFDAVFLLGAHGAALDWEGLAQWLDNDLARASLYAMVTYLPRYQVAPAPAHVLARLSRNGGMAGPLQLRLIHAALDRHLIEARPWRHALPPPMPGRYSLGHQFRKRVVGRAVGPV